MAAVKYYSGFFDALLKKYNKKKYAFIFYTLFEYDSFMIMS